MGLADINSDGRLDLMVASRQGLAIYVNTDGLGTFDFPFVISPDETVACLVDVDADGSPDVIGSSDMGGGFNVHHNIGSNNFITSQHFADGLSANDIQHADLDGDGDQDILFASEVGQLVICYNTDGLGTFGAPQVIATLSGLAYPQAIDMDGDLDIDILYSSSVANEVDLCRNTNGDFGTPEQITLEGHGISKDLDNDGHADAITVNTAAGNVRWQRNTDGVGDLSSPATLDPAFSAPEFVNATDLDGDGDMDAIVTSATQNEVAWFENTDGQGTFGPRQTIADDYSFLLNQDLFCFHCFDKCAALTLLWRPVHPDA